jgi:hypothetical protein
VLPRENIVGEMLCKQFFTVKVTEEGSKMNIDEGDVKL